MQTTSDQETRGESKTRLVEQINSCLRSGDYSRALDFLRGTAADFPNDAQFLELERLAHDGVKRNAEANRLITESQELFAQQKSAEAIQLLRKAYELDKSNSLARAILANALVEHAQSIVETDWLQAETLTNQSLGLNPAHPTAKTILALIVTRKETSSVEDWVTQARKRQSSGDLFAALAWVAEGLAVHPDDPKLTQIQEEIQRDQNARRRQARRGDVEDLRRLQREINGATDVAAKQVLAERIQAIAAKHWTDGEILSIANALLLRLGLVPQESSTAAQRSKGATVILHVPRPNAPETSLAATSPVPLSPIASTVATSPVAPSPVLPGAVPAGNVPAATVPPQDVPPKKVPPGKVQPPSITPAAKVLPVHVPPVKAPNTAPEPQLAPPQVTSVPVTEPPTPAAKTKSPSSQTRPSTISNSTILILISAAAIIVIAAIFFFARKHSTIVEKSPSVAPAVSAPNASTLTAPAPTVSTPAVSTPTVSTPAEATPEPSLSALPASSDTKTVNVPPTVTPEVTHNDQPPAAATLGTLLVVAGQDDASVFLNGKLQRQLTHAGQLSLPNLELKDYVVQVSKSGYKDPPQQKIRIRKGEQALIFNLQPQPRLASLNIQGGNPGTAVFVDQAPVGSIQPDGTLSVATVNPGDHTVELRKDRFKPRQFKKHFVAGETISLAAADAALEPAPAELKITFTPADAKVALVKADHLTLVSSGVPLNLSPGTYTLTARTADSFTRSSTLEVIPGQSKTVDLSLAPNDMSKWDDPAAWRPEGDSFIRKGGEFVLYKVVPASGTFVFSAMPAKGHTLQWVLNYTDSKNYILFQMDENNFYRTVIRNGQKTDQIIVPDKGDKKSFRTLHIRVSPTEIVHQIKHGYSWKVLDQWTQPGTNLSTGKFGFYIPGNDEVALSSFAQYVELNTH